MDVFIDYLLTLFDLCVLLSFLVFSSVSSSNGCVQQNVGLGQNAPTLFEYYSLVFLRLSAPLHNKGFKP